MINVVIILFLIEFGVLLLNIRRAVKKESSIGEPLVSFVIYLIVTNRTNTPIYFAEKQTELLIFLTLHVVSYFVIPYFAYVIFEEDAPLPNKESGKTTTRS
ncbi:hypothetical protein HNR48_002065 [Pseudoteredinibacter isoporae]|uniref:Uncharacterized protein n=1 Tax=Pseudoteredinibacter isoporae TaxID=570281 RepID=A0A7X0JT42_9GAMM|nr:hypothetical protein [Pseudoteredinibacter isoporae]